LTNSISITVVEVTKSIHVTVIMALCQIQPHDSLTSFYVKLPWQWHWQVMNDVMVFVKMS